VWNVKVTRHSLTGTSHLLRHQVPPGKMVSFLSRKWMCRQVMGAWWGKWHKMLESQQTIALQLIARTFPSPMQLFMQGLADSARCKGGGCNASRATAEHIQCQCPSTKEARIAAHHRGWRAVFSQIEKVPGRGKHWEEESISKVCKHIRDITGTTIPDMPTTDFYDPRRKENRLLTWAELKAERPDGHSIIKTRKHLFVHEYTRGSDTLENFEVRLKAGKQAWYLPWINHLKLHLEPKGWTVEQLDWTAGVRGSIPELEWEANFDKLKMCAKARPALLQNVFEETIEGGVAVFAAYRANVKAQEPTMRSTR
jgi:hypothetical protein